MTVLVEALCSLNPLVRGQVANAFPAVSRTETDLADVNADNILFARVDVPGSPRVYVTEEKVGVSCLSFQVRRTSMKCHD